MLEIDFWYANFVKKSNLNYLKVVERLLRKIEMRSKSMALLLTLGLFGGTLAACEQGVDEEVDPGIEGTEEVEPELAPEGEMAPEGEVEPEVEGE